MHWYGATLEFLIQQWHCLQYTLRSAWCVHELLPAARASISLSTNSSSRCTRRSSSNSSPVSSITCRVTDMECRLCTLAQNMECALYVLKWLIGARASRMGLRPFCAIVCHFGGHLGVHTTICTNSCHPFGSHAELQCRAEVHSTQPS